MRSDTGARMRVAWLRQHAEKIDDAPDTLCRYRRELERLLFRCRVKRGTSPSSPRVEDREAYEAFLASASAALCEPLRAARGLRRGRPLGDEPMAFDDQRYSIRTIWDAFDWPVRISCLAGDARARVAADPVRLHDRRTVPAMHRRSEVARRTPGRVVEGTVADSSIFS
ncbi:hypothetical protein [Burkholderia plantarii]|uniref:Uncharacterized protein n=1 Tax=Burkholderia plantarii TaxID=41899 RepID=A0A0B6S937_BURPL|nr:hypothetical protein [Burkholderia plantarii]AJK48761.1 hypothetical protein BGL_2c06770 [Burkholderia plantarii]